MFTRFPLPLSLTLSLHAPHIVRAALAAPAPPQLELRLANAAQYIAFSPDSKVAATASHDGWIVLWNVRNGEMLHTIHLPNSENARSIAFTYDGRAMAAASNNLDDMGGVHEHSSQARLWDVATGKQIRTLNGKSWAMGLVCSPTEDLVAVRETSMTSLAMEPGSVVRIYSGQTGALRSEVQLASHLVDPIQFSKDGSLLAIADAPPDLHDGSPRNSRSATIVLWSAGKSTEIGRIKTEIGPVHSIKFSPDGLSVASNCGDWESTQAIQIWDTHTFAQKQVLSQDGSSIGDFAFSPDGKQIAAYHIGSKIHSDRVVITWDLSNGKPLKTLPTHSITSSICYSNDGSQLYTGLGVAGSYPTEQNWWNGTRDCAIAMWNPVSGQELRTSGANRNINDGQFALSPDGATLLASGDRLRLFDAQTLVVRSTAPLTNHVRMAVRLSPNARQLAIFRYSNGAGILMDLTSGRITREFDKPLEYPTDLAFAPNGSTLWTSTVTYKEPTTQGLPIPLGVIEEFDLRANLIKHIGGPPPPTPLGLTATWNRILFSPTESGVMIVGGQGRKLGEGPTDREALATTAQGRSSWTPDQRYGGKDDTVDGLTWWRNGERIDRSAQAITGDVFGLAITPDGKTLASSGRFETVLWNAYTGAQISRFHTRFFGGASDMDTDIRPLAFSPDGSLLASGDERTVRFYSEAGGKWSEILALAEQDEPINDLAFSPDGQLLATADRDGLARIWDVRSGKEKLSLPHDEPVDSVVWRNETLITGCQDSKIRFWNSTSGKLVLTVVAFPEAYSKKPLTWIAYTPEGLYDGSADIGRLLRWRLDDQVYPASKFEKMMHRPDLVRRTLARQIP